LFFFLLLGAGGKACAWLDLALSLQTRLKGRMTRICLIDDDIMVRDALALGLSDAGYDVVVAPGAAAGLDVLARQHIDLVVTDLNMPGTHGAELIAQARARWPHLPIIAMSGSSIIEGRDIDEVARSVGANSAIAKPFRAKQLAGMIADILAEHGGA
jgi:CheY-like chemotaxis protein